MKRTFDCGHTGQGKFCHRCANEARPALLAAKKAAENQARIEAALARAAAEAAERKAEQDASSRRAAAEAAAYRDKLVREATAAPVDLRAAFHLPLVLERALAILRQLGSGAHPLALGGKPIKTRRGDFSIPVGNSYRLLVDKSTLRPIHFLSHENYNGLI